MIKLSKCLNGIDKTTFDCDIQAIDWYEYTRQAYFVGSKLFLKETDKSLEKAKTTFK